MMMFGLGSRLCTLKGTWLTSTLLSLPGSFSQDSKMVLNNLIQIRSYPTKLRRRRKYNKGVNIKLFTPGEPVSGSVSFKEDLEEFNNQPYEFNVHSVTKKGFYRFQKPYQPPDGVKEDLVDLIKSIVPSLKQLSEQDLLVFKLTCSKTRYELLSKANEKFNHFVPNSMMYMIETFGHLVQFYEKAIEVTTPYEDLIRRTDLPPNLHIQKEPLRFHPDDDTAFGGITAFPQSSTIVTGLRAQKKYKSYYPPKPWKV